MVTIILLLIASISMIVIHGTAPWYVWTCIIGAAVLEIIDAIVEYVLRVVTDKLASMVEVEFLDEGEKNDEDDI